MECRAWCRRRSYRNLEAPRARRRLRTTRGDPRERLFKDPVFAVAAKVSRVFTTRPVRCETTQTAEITFSSNPAQPSPRRSSGPRAEPNPKESPRSSVCFARNARSRKPRGSWTRTRTRTVTILMTILEMTRRTNRYCTLRTKAPKVPCEGTRDTTKPRDAQRVLKRLKSPKTSLSSKLWLAI